MWIAGSPPYLWTNHISAEMLPFKLSAKEGVPRLDSTLTSWPLHSRNLSQTLRSNPWGAIPSERCTLKHKFQETRHYANDKSSNIKILFFMVGLEMRGKLFPIMKAAAWGDRGQDSCPFKFLSICFDVTLNPIDKNDKITVVCQNLTPCLINEIYFKW